MNSENTPLPANDRTTLVHSGRESARFSGLVNTPIHRGSTILANNLDDWQNHIKESGNPMGLYGRFGTPTTRSLESAVSQLEGGYKSHIYASGLSACNHALLSFLKTGDHVLMTDSVYGPVRLFATQVLERFGIEVEFYDPLIGAGIKEKMRKNTRVVYVEAPGSWTFEMQDIPLIADIAHKGGAIVMMDNTWASPLYYKPFEHGVDVSIQAATKYLVGHSDALLGVATATKEAWPILQAGSNDFGQTAGPDDIYLALRGMRTLDVRLERHWKNGVVLAENLSSHKLVEKILHPALPGDDGHAIWKRDFLGASGLFGVVLKPMSDAALSALFNRFQLFGLGLSWGGFESLALPSYSPPKRAGIPWPHEGKIMRVHVGLEDIDDLIEDMNQALNHAQKIMG